MGLGSGFAGVALAGAGRPVGLAPAVGRAAGASGVGEGAAVVEGVDGVLDGAAVADGMDDVGGVEGRGDVDGTWACGSPVDAAEVDGVAVVAVAALVACPGAGSRSATTPTTNSASAATPSASASPRFLAPFRAGGALGSGTDTPGVSSAGGEAGGGAAPDRALSEGAVFIERSALAAARDASSRASSGLGSAPSPAFGTMRRVCPSPRTIHARRVGVELGARPLRRLVDELGARRGERVLGPLARGRGPGLVRVGIIVEGIVAPVQRAQPRERVVELGVGLEGPRGLVVSLVEAASQHHLAHGRGLG